MRIQHLALATLVAAVSASPTVRADDPSANSSQTNAPRDEARLTDVELGILAHVHQVNLMEIDAGKLARTHSTMPAIKTYALTVVNDHAKNDRDIQAIARKHHQTIPAHETPPNEGDRQAAADMKAEMTGLARLSGSDFDREFLQMMVKGHEMELAKLGPEMDECVSSDMKDLLDGMRPVLQKHADNARSLESNNAQASR